MSPILHGRSYWCLMCGRLFIVTSAKTSDQELPESQSPVTRFSYVSD